MATLADLKARIVRETHRDDLLTDLAPALSQHIAQAVEQFAGESFWFNRIRATGMATPGVAEMALPTTVRRAEIVFVSGELDKIALEEVPEQQGLSKPLRWAAYGAGLYFDPIPDSAYTVTIIGAAHVAAPSADGDSSIWTNEAADLIAAQAKGTLYLAVFQDREQAEVELALAQNILRRLKTESRKHDKSPLRVDSALLRTGARA